MRLFPCFLILFVFACQSPKPTIDMDGEQVQVSNPPNMIQLDGNLFMDKTEISNLDWREYEYWIKSVFGEGSEAHLNMLPDTTVWRKSDGEQIEAIVKHYYRNPVYDGYPVVGVSFEQVKRYAAWRSSRVVEVMLIQQELMKEQAPLTEDGYFDLDLWLSGDRVYQIDASAAVLIPRFDLPKLADLERARQEMHFADGENTPENSEHFVLYNQSYPGCDDCENFPVQTYTHTKMFPIQHLIGNVAEMTDQPGIATGGSWKHTLEESLPGQEITYEEPAPWLGFRLVASWERI
ncbi:MAG: SUMF1/EgtB/PvdO family nonheme iron enzyme [Bacteroidota bacterium]